MLLLPLSATAATLRVVHVAPTAAATNEAPRDMRKPKPAPTPLPAPAPTDHYASPPTIPLTWKI